MRSLELRIRGVWNAGYSAEEALPFLNRSGQPDQVSLETITSRFVVYEKHLGVASFPASCIASENDFSDETGVIPVVEDYSDWSEEYKNWKGVSVNGADLREAIKAMGGRT